MTDSEENLILKTRILLLVKRTLIAWFACLTVSSMEGANFVVTSRADSGPGTLRQAILDSNATLLTAPNVITFDLPTTGFLPLIIAVSTPLPTITRPVQILGDTQPGSLSTQPVIDLTFAGGFLAAPGLTINTTNCTVRRLAIYGFRQGILLESWGYHLIAGNHVGINTNGLLAGGNSASGIWINSSVGNIIGGPSSQDRNVISANGYNGIYIDSSSVSNKVIGNYIGLAPAGTSARGNQHCGIKIINGDYNQIGGFNPGESNVISGNLGTLLADESSLLGVGSGIQLEGFPACTYATGNVIQGNLIGTDVTGSTAMGNFMGIRLGGCEQTLIGGNTAGARNIISGNVQEGIGTHPYVIARLNTIQGNYIGTDITGLNPLGNGSDGIRLGQICSVPACGCDFYSLVGGTNSPGEANIIAYNGANGVYAEAFKSYSILGNSIYDNGASGIDLSPPGVTLNDFMDTDTGDTAANDGQNFPVLTSATSDTSRIFISGTLNSEPSRQYLLQFFRNLHCDVTATNYGEGRFYIGQELVTTDAGGNASFSVTLTFILSGDVITSTATSPEGSTSEFSRCIQLLFPAPLTIVRSGTMVIISWPASSGSGWILQRSPISSLFDWKDVPAIPDLVGDQYQIKIPIGPEGYLYRLRST